MCDVCGDTPEFKSAPGTAERLKELDEKTRHTILEYGHQVRFIFPAEGDDDSVQFWYSVGRCFYDKAEFLVTGSLPLPVGHYMVNEIARMVDAGEIALGDGVVVPPDTLLAGFPCRLVRCDPVASEMNGATEIGGNDIEAYQIIWPDKEGHFPEDPNFDARFKQPVFALA